MIVTSLGKKLPRRYQALPRVHSRASVEIDVATFESESAESPALAGDGEGGVAMAVWAPEANPERGH